MRKFSSSVSHEKYLIEEFRKEPARAISYLNASLEFAFEDNDPELFLIGLATFAKAFGMTKIAKQAKLQRESLHRMLSRKGNPEWNSLFRVFKALHLRPKLERIGPVSAASGR